MTAWLTRILGDFSRAEEIVQDALLAALEQWPSTGIPEHPRGWLQTVARRRAIDTIRREVRYREKLAELEAPIPQEPDNRLELIFMCCHPALAPEAQVALTLRAAVAATGARPAKNRPGGYPVLPAARGRARRAAATGAGSAVPDVQRG